jgi:hypothetical protein
MIDVRQSCGVNQVPVELSKVRRIIYDEAGHTAP